MSCRIIGIALLLTVLMPAPEGDDRVGQPAPKLELRHWLNSAPLEMDALRDQVVLLRWWTDGCAFCSTTAPALNELHRKYEVRGLRVIGVFHPKPAGDQDLERARRTAARYGFEFPVALDPHWKTLQRWWLDHSKRGWTSVSFLVDKQGIIRYVHPGGEFHEDTSGRGQSEHQTCQRQYREIDGLITRLLAER